MRLHDPNPRSLVLGAICLLALAMASPRPAAAQCGPNDFVTVRRGNFECGGQPFRFVGANNREMVHLWHALVGYGGLGGPEAAQVLYDQLAAAEDMGVTVLRVYLPREEKAIANFSSRAEYHRFLGNQLEMLMNFATRENPPAIVNPLDSDYQSFRPSGGPPAPNMKFLVSLTDSIYDPGKGGFTNPILKDDQGAYTRPFGGLLFLDYQWFLGDRRNQFLNYEDNYKPLVESITDRFRNDPRIFGWELGNEMQAGKTDDMRDFVRDMAGAIKRRDRNHLVTSGFISACHAANLDFNAFPCPQRIARTLYQPLDFGSVHMYNNEWSNPPCEGCTGYLGQDVDMGYYFNSEFPYIVGELGFSTPAGSDPGFQGGTWYLDGGPITFESNRTEPRTNNIFWTLNALYERKEADGVFPWAFFAGTDGANFSIDGARGMDQVAHSDWDGLFDVYQCRAWSLDAANRGLGRIDLAIQRITWSNLTRPNQAAQVGDRIQFRVHVCNAGDLATNQGLGLSLFLDRDGANPAILESFGNAFAPENLSPGHIATIDVEWTAVDPSSLDPRLSGPETVVVGLVDDVNRYPNEITETNNGHAIDFPILSGACVSLINPSFENPVIPPPWIRVSSMPGWTGPVDIHREPDLPASDGMQVVDLNQNGAGSIQQTFATVPGQAYRVRFFHGVNYYCTSSASFSVDINSASIGTFTGNATPVEASATFTATGTSTTLRFRSLSGGCGASTIDHVRVTCQ